MRQYVLTIVTASVVALGLCGAERAEAMPLGATGTLRTVTDDINRAEPVQYAGGRCWRNGWHGMGWYPCWHPGVAWGAGTWGGGTWGAWHGNWHNHYAWHGNWHDHYRSNWHWHDGGRRAWHGHRGGGRHAGGHRGGGRHAHASGHHGGGRHHGGGHRGGGHHGGGHRR